MRQKSNGKWSSWSEPDERLFLALSAGHLYARDIKELRFEQHPCAPISTPAPNGVARSFADPVGVHFATCKFSTDISGQ
jgi:hypothetical protein